MKPVRHSLIRRREKTASDYADVSGCSTRARSVKSQIYAAGKSSAADAGRTASAPALPERTGVEAEKARLVPRFAQVSEASEAPINNMGENLIDASGPEQQPGVWVSVCDEDFGEVSLVITDTGEVKTQLVRRPSATQVCIIDWCNFNVLEDTFFKTARRMLVADEEIIEEASVQLEKIFGMGITSKRSTGMNFYRESWVLGDNMGFVCFGGQRGTLMVTLNGLGCQCALAGWENRLYDFLVNVAVRPVISRIDLAHDDIEGNYLSVDWASEQDKGGGFSFKKGGRPPEYRELGAWRRPSGKGRTVTIGRRDSSKFCRFYEKGKALGDKSSLWCRCEIEFKNTNTVINLRVLLNPSSFFCDAYPCIAEFAETPTPSCSGQVNSDTTIGFSAIFRS